VRAIDDTRRPAEFIPRGCGVHCIRQQLGAMRHCASAAANVDGKEASPTDVLFPQGRAEIDRASTSDLSFPYTFH